uniref:Uncharacterized protein n=1 Tax=Glossina brevipalpis TaxID=37001 RepID=A0A1A9WPF4_9MUSC
MPNPDNVLRAQPKPVPMKVDSSEVLPDTHLLNQFNGTNFVGQEPYNLSGIYLIKFRNETITINGRTFSYSEITFSKPLPAIIQPRVANPHIEENLTLELVKEMHLNNTQSIAHLDIERKRGDSICYALVVFIMLTFLCLLIRKLKKSQKPTPPETINVDIPLPSSNIVLNQSKSYTVLAVLEIVLLYGNAEVNVSMLPLEQSSLICERRDFSKEISIFLNSKRYWELLEEDEIISIGLNTGPSNPLCRDMQRAG